VFLTAAAAKFGDIGDKANTASGGANYFWASVAVFSGEAAKAARSNLKRLTHCNPTALDAPLQKYRTIFNANAFGTRSRLDLIIMIRWSAKAPCCK
tara:strand:- start:28583 stop:28870 length:288 start_codon:yes stop_codon:yes gene_type:complete